MFKNLVAPIQAWLLSQGRCVGCGTTLDKGTTNNDIVTCKCGRIFKKEGDKFRRANMEEIKR